MDFSFFFFWSVGGWGELFKIAIQNQKAYENKALKRTIWILMKRSLCFLPTTLIRRHFMYDSSARCNCSTVTLRYGSTHWSTFPLQFWKSTWMSFGAGPISLSSIFLSAMISINETTHRPYLPSWEERSKKVIEKNQFHKKSSSLFHLLSNALTEQLVVKTKFIN